MGFDMVITFPSSLTSRARQRERTRNCEEKESERVCVDMWKVLRERKVNSGRSALT